MPSVSLNVKQQIITVIKRFKFEELEDAVFPIFPEISWHRVKSKIVQNHESLTTLHAVQYIQQDIKKAGISDAELKDRLATLEVIDVSRHYKKKIWYTYELKGKDTPSELSLEEIQAQIKESFSAYHMEMDVKMISHNGLVFLSIKDRPKKKQKKTILPTYFSYATNEKFFFCAKKVVLKNALMAFTSGMGYQSCKSIKLMGRDVPSLVEMLMTRKNVLQKNGMQAPLPFRPTPPIVTTSGVDFTQHRQRQKYADKHFGKNPPTFEFLRVKALDQKWKDEDAQEKLPNDTVFTGIEFRSSSIPNFLKTLVTRKILLTPLPCYAANILSIARNDLTLKES